LKNCWGEPNTSSAPFSVGMLATRLAARTLAVALRPTLHPRPSPRTVRAMATEEAAARRAAAAK
jgi:hypothetical protein